MTIVCDVKAETVLALPGEFGEGFMGQIDDGKEVGLSKVMLSGGGKNHCRSGPSFGHERSVNGPLAGDSVRREKNHF